MKHQKDRILQNLFSALVGAGLIAACHSGGNAHVSEVSQTNASPDIMYPVITTTPRSQPTLTSISPTTAILSTPIEAPTPMLTSTPPKTLSPTPLTDAPSGLYLFFANFWYVYQDPAVKLDPLSIPHFLPVNRFWNKMRYGFNAWAFSHYSEELAFIGGSKDQAELWISRLDLTEERFIWEGTGDFGFGESLTYMMWGPADRSILFGSYVNGYDFLLTVPGGELYEFAEAPHFVARSIRHDALAIWYPLKDTTAGDYLVVEASGETWVTQDVPAEATAIKEHLFSPDGLSLLAILKNDQFALLDHTGQITRLPATTTGTSRINYMTSFFKWSLDGRKILLYGDNAAACPKGEQGQVLICWHVLDAETLQIIWSPPEKGTFTCCDAAFSPDGEKVIVYFITSGLSGTHGEIVNLATQEVENHILWEAVQSGVVIYWK